MPAADADQLSELLRRPSVADERVLYLNLEIQRAFFVRRRCKICEARQLKIEADRLHILNLRGARVDLARIAARVRKSQFALIIIDPIYKLLGGRDENAAHEIADLLGRVEALAVQKIVLVQPDGTPAAPSRSVVIGENRNRRNCSCDTV